jgi:hypothetical protein
MDDVTGLLQAWGRGDLEAREDLMPLVYKELRRCAAAYLRRERADHTLQPTALVHEAYMRLVGQERVVWQSRAHFYGVAAQMMRDLAYVRALGETGSPRRTPEQSETAHFWYEDSPLGWNRITNTVARQRRLDLWSTARAFALVNFALADGFIAGFDAKYRFRFWRPVTAIHEAATDGNSLTERDPTWQPFLVTPPVPDHPSTHTVLGAAAAEVLIELFGDKVRYDTTSLTLPGVTRHFKGFSAAARENGLSRIYAGIHFRHAVKEGHRLGRSIGRAKSIRGPADAETPWSWGSAGQSSETSSESSFAEIRSSIPPTYTSVIRLHPCTLITRERFFVRWSLIRLATGKKDDGRCALRWTGSPAR